MINNFQNIPKQMKEEGFFCTHYKKTPTNKTKPNQKETFRTFEETMKLKKDYEGIGIGIFDSFCGIDIDHCINDKGEMTDLAKQIIKKINSYTEKSLSGTGIHIIFKCNNQKQFDSMKYYTKMNEKQLNENGFTGTGGLELYQGNFDNRYLTLTGNILINDLKTIDSSTIEEIVAEYMKKPQIMSKNVERKTSSRNFQEDIQFLNIGLTQGTKLIELWNSTPSGSGGNESETDLQLLCQLAYWTNCNETLMKQSFEESPYFQRKDDYHQKKWYRDDYSSGTIEKAIASVNTTARENNEIFQEQQKEKEAERMKQEQAKQEQLNQEQQKQNDEIKELIENKNAMNIMSSFFETIDSGIYKPCSTGFKKLDEKTNGGISNQSIVILGGGTSVGKTTFTLNLISNFAKTRPIVYFTLEMSEEQILSKIYSHLAYKTGGMEISSTSILQSYDKNKMTEYQKGKLIEEIQKHSELKNIIVRFPSSSNIDFLMTEIEAITTKLKESGQTEPPIIVIDYLQFIQGETREDSQALIKRIQRLLKKYAIEENTIVFLLSANSREANRQKQSSIDSGRDTSDIEYTSDYNLQLNFTEWEHKINTKATLEELVRKNPKEMTLTIHKQRFGERELMIDYKFNGIANTFEECLKDSPTYYTDDSEEDEETTTTKRKINKLSDF